jgi:hypothetical protein
MTTEIKTIEAAYNDLRANMLDLRADLTALEGVGTLRRSNRGRLAEIATSIAAAVWPAHRAAYADMGSAMPEGPARYDLVGYQYGPFGLVCSTRALAEHEREVAFQAVARLRVEISAEHDAASARFESARKAIVAGQVG